jgi:hypothetical protein
MSCCIIASVVFLVLSICVVWMIPIRDKDDDSLDYW